MNGNRGKKLVLFAFTVFSLSSLSFVSSVFSFQPLAPVEVARVPSFCEGIVFDAEGNAYISHGKFITRITPQGGAGIWAEAGRPNGHKILADGIHLVCDGVERAVLRFSREGKLLGRASSESDGRQLRAPNDLTLDEHGGFYFTDPGGSSRENPIGAIHYVDRRGRTQLVADGLVFPNGIVLRPDGKTLLVADSRRNLVLVYRVFSPGRIGAPKVFAGLPEKGEGQVENQPDGMCLDRQGNLYIAHIGMRQIQVLNPEGRLIRRYPAGNLYPSNVAFGGPKMDQLYITGKDVGSEGILLRLDLTGVRGLKLIR